jgi:dual specificity phosphatase 12
MSTKMKEQYGITHVLTVCQDYPSSGPNHLVISVEDEAEQNLLQYFNSTCKFIQDALDSKGRVLVHCMMGVSRSTTVVAAYCESYSL